MICPKLFYSGEVLPVQPFRRTHTPDSGEKESKNTKTRNKYFNLRNYIANEVETLINEMYYQNKDYEEGLKIRERWKNQFFERRRRLLES